MIADTVPTMTSSAYSSFLLVTPRIISQTIVDASRVTTTFGPPENHRMKFTTLGWRSTTPVFVNSNKTFFSLAASHKTWTSKSLETFNKTVSPKILKNTVSTVIFGTFDNPHGLTSRSLGTFSDSRLEHLGGLNRSNDPRNRGYSKYFGGDHTTTDTSDFKNVRSHHIGQTRKSGNFVSSSYRITLNKHRGDIKASSASAIGNYAAGSTLAELNGIAFVKVSKFLQNFSTDFTRQSEKVKKSLTRNFKITKNTNKIVDGSNPKSKGSGTKSSFSKLKLNKQFHSKQKIIKMYGDGFQRLKQKLEISNDSTKQSAGQYEERAYQTRTGDSLSTGQTLVPRGGDDRHLSSDYTKSFVPDAQQHRKAEYTGHALTLIKGTY